MRTSSSIFRVNIALLSLLIGLQAKPVLAQVSEADAVAALIKQGGCYRLETFNGHVTRFSYLLRYANNLVLLHENPKDKSGIRNPISHLVYMEALDLDGSGVDGFHVNEV